MSSSTREQLLSYLKSNPQELQPTAPLARYLEEGLKAAKKTKPGAANAYQKIARELAALREGKTDPQNFVLNLVQIVAAQPKFFAGASAAEVYDELLWLFELCYTESELRRLLKSRRQRTRDEDSANAPFIASTETTTFNKASLYRAFVGVARDGQIRKPDGVSANAWEKKWLGMIEPDTTNPSLLRNGIETSLPYKLGIFLKNCTIRTTINDYVRNLERSKTVDFAVLDLLAGDGGFGGDGESMRHENLLKRLQRVCGEILRRPIGEWDKYVGDVVTIGSAPSRLGEASPVLAVIGREQFFSQVASQFGISPEALTRNLQWLLRDSAKGLSRQTYKNIQRMLRFPFTVVLRDADGMARQEAARMETSAHKSIFSALEYAEQTFFRFLDAPKIDSILDDAEEGIASEALKSVIRIRELEQIFG